MSSSITTTYNNNNNNNNIACVTFTITKSEKLININS